ncbi:uncharacterized protein LOC105784453 [Gossypium raimondii]|uniref:uncharacterized protein LOC105784453 n=1 Tax=Gossypium raimondii TaxID=29730 RepID=UPI00227CC1F4|nr:uncharacterized protein LOC105784453 [Gossypium raimondii]
MQLLRVITITLPHPRFPNLCFPLLLFRFLPSSSAFRFSDASLQRHLLHRNLARFCIHPVVVHRTLPRFPWLQIIMSGVPQSHASSQASRGSKKKWIPEEDAALVSCMVDLHNVGTFNADTGFKADYLNELEKMLEKALPRAMLKAKPNIESRIRCLKRE